MGLFAAREYDSVKEKWHIKLNSLNKCVCK